MMFRTKTVDGVLSGFQRMVDDLNKIYERETQAGADKRRAASELQDSAKLHSAEALRAYNTADKIRDLIA